MPKMPRKSKESNSCEGAKMIKAIKITIEPKVEPHGDVSMRVLIEQQGKQDIAFSKLTDPISFESFFDLAWEEAKQHIKKLALEQK